MFLCELYNLTIGIPAYSFNKWSITEDGKTVKGLLGSQLQKFLDSRKCFPYKCKLVNIYKVGDKFENGSYDGALGAIERKEIDCFMKAEIPFIINENIIHSYPILTEDFTIFQLIEKKVLDDSIFKMQLINSFNLKFLYFYCLVIILFFLILLIFFNFNSFFIKPNFRFYFLKNFISIKKLKKNFKKGKSLSFFLLGIFWFDFLTKQITTNNIKTTKVIVDTSELITTEDKLFNSPLKAAWLEGETDLIIAKNAPKDTFLNKFYLLKNENPIKIFKKSIDLDLNEAVKKYFFFMKNYLLLTAINLLGSFLKNDAFLNEIPFYSIYSVFYITKGIEPIKIKFIYQISQLSTELGFFINLRQNALKIKDFNDLKKNKIYFNLNSYIDDYTKFDSLKYENFHYFLLSLFFFNFLFLIFFLIHHLMMKT